MAKVGLEAIEGSTRSGGFFFPFSEVGFSWNPAVDGLYYPSAGLFASVSQMGIGGGGGGGFGVAPIPPDPRGDAELLGKYVSPEFGYRAASVVDSVAVGEAGEAGVKKKKKGRKGVKIRIGNPSVRRLFSGAIAGAVSRTAVAPLETIRTHLMVGSSGSSSTEVFENIMRTDGWKGLFRGNFVNVIRVAPSKAIELFAFDTVKKVLTPQVGEPPKIPIPPSLVAGACAGVTSTLFTYPLELLKTRLTIERDVYNNLLHAFVKIVREEGPTELYRGLTPSLIGVIPYAATNYYAYDTLKKAYKKAFKTEEIGNIATLMIGSAAGAISSSATFPLEVARKQMQVGAVGGRQVYKNMLHALMSILEKEGLGGLYRGLGPSCMKLVPAAGISFMCYEACKKVLIDKEDDP
ncbi:adenine nucleotide transporter BT1, chloroplastic/mitochondrial-like [Iris pallida]|uniref:Adenine nucleotide transporter BT1, chloroplastic/mitochondrial-like n=1 Tax=Iris pallida TaxID=29817 RepID=A0AAX6I5Q9_IRIPA|nr:adenine nucleotide transporter BT1, chloroplastic/mitochondrial-like [Iris pallida]